MKKYRIMLQIAAMVILIVPNLIYLICNFSVFKDRNVVAISMIAMLIFAIVGLGALLHFKVKAGVWTTIIGIFILAVGDLAHITGIALLIEGIGLILDGYIIRPILIKLKIRELEENGESITYTRPIE